MDIPDEIRSDLSVFHRIDEMEAMPALRFWAFASRLPFYDGAVRAARQAVMPMPEQETRAVGPVAAPADEELELWQHMPKPPPGAELVNPAAATAILASYGPAHIGYHQAPLA